MLIALVILGLIALAWVWLLVGPTHRYGFRETLDASTDVGSSLIDERSWPAVSVVIPARNEADTLRSTIPTICGQDYPDLRVILVDDQSEDESGRVIEKLKADHPGLLVVRGRARAAGWYGKQWAVQQGLELAKTEWLLFTDADIIYDRAAVRQAVRYMLAHDLEMLSLLPQLILVSVWERLALSAAMAVLAALFPLSRVNNPRSKVALAAGAFILIRREAYERVGGHEAVRGEMIEDLSLARLLKGAGTRMQSRLTRDLIRTRMYEGWAELWEGLSKNAYAGIGYSLWKYAAGIVVGLLFGVLPPVYLVASLVGGVVAPSAGMWGAVALSAVANFCMIAVHGRCVRHLGLPWYYRVLLPAGGVFYSLFVTSSVWQHYFCGGAQWKGRRYQANA
ncbi:MAG: glycosyltransferase [Planctomycetota bacterium]|nr:glycosyltransferase [Planctomycetota bacterium]